MSGDEREVYRRRCLSCLYSSGSFYSIRPHTAKCRLREHCVVKTDYGDAKRERQERLPTGKEHHGCELDLEREEIRGVEQAESLGRKLSNEKAVP